MFLRNNAASKVLLTKNYLSEKPSFVGQKRVPLGWENLVLIGLTRIFQLANPYGGKMNTLIAIAFSLN